MSQLTCSIIEKEFLKYCHCSLLFRVSLHGWGTIPSDRLYSSSAL